MKVIITAPCIQELTRLIKTAKAVNQGGELLKNYLTVLHIASSFTQLQEHNSDAIFGHVPFSNGFKGEKYSD